MEEKHSDGTAKDEKSKLEESLCNVSETSVTLTEDDSYSKMTEDEDIVNTTDSVKDQSQSSDSKNTKKFKKSKQNWKNRFGKQKQKGITVQDVPENNLNRRPFHSIYKFRAGRKRTQSFPATSKFFLPYKRPRKEVIIPPTKFLLGGNISDPLNLNSLQDEDINRAMNAVTPKSSPLPTPPRHKAKIEVIIPPDIRDPLNLLNPLDNEEYEKQLEPKKPRRPRQRRGKYKRRSSECSTNVPSGSPTQASPVKEESSAPTDVVAAEAEQIPSAEPSTSAVIKDLKLDLSNVRVYKRTNSESEGSQKGKDCKKFKRMDSLDKIVSPVIPQPGAWMRVHTRGGGHAAKGIGRGGYQGKPRPPLPRNSFLPSDTVPVNSVPLPKFRSQDARYQYGNYDRYYGYRNLDTMMDIRLKVFGLNRHLFNNKDVLDIGCNVGHISIAIARDFGAKSVTGIDIDNILIARARKNVCNFVIVPPFGHSPPTQTPLGNPEQSTSQLELGSCDKNISVDSSASDVTKNEKDLSSRNTAIVEKSDPVAPDDSVRMESNLDRSDSIDNPQLSINRGRARVKRNRRSHNRQGQDAPKCYFPVSCPILYGPLEVTGFPLETSCSSFPQNIAFQQANYILKDESLLNAEPYQYDLIMCLSVTKWFHLNWGDVGLKLAFKRMFAQLRPGGKLILEAQSWASYKKKKKLTETIYRNFTTIEFFPNKFREYLLSPEVGFSKCCVLGAPQHLSKGFRRPILLFIKGDFTPSKVRWSDTYAPSSHHQPEAGVEGRPNKVYANVVSPASRRWSGNNTPLYGAATPYSVRLESNAEESPFYDPRSDSYLPSYSCSAHPKTVYASLSSPLSDYGGTPAHSSESACPAARGGVYAAAASPASPFLEPSPGNSATPGRPFAPSPSAGGDAQLRKRIVYASLPQGSPREESGTEGRAGLGQPVYSPSVAGPSLRGHSPLHTGSALSPLPLSLPEDTDDNRQFPSD